MEQKSFLGALFDFSFEEFVTIRLIKVLYGILLALVALGTLGGLVGALGSMVSGEFLAGIGILVMTPIMALLYLVLARAWTEIIIVMFRIAENTQDLVDMKRDDARGSAPTPPAAVPPPMAAP